MKATTSGAIITGILTVPQLDVQTPSSFTGITTFNGGAFFPDNVSLAFGDSDDTTITHTTSNGTRIDHTDPGHVKDHYNEGQKYDLHTT